MKALLVALMFQQPGDSAATHARLVARGLPADVAASVSAVVRQTNANGLPGRAIADKAVEGAFKRVPPPRILAAVRDLAQRLERARTDLRAGGVTQLDGGVIAGSAEASAQGIGRADQVAVIRAAPASDAAAAGLSVAAALVVQGLAPGTAARLVTESFRAGRSASQVLDLPAAARALQARGLAATDVGRQLLDNITTTGLIQGQAGTTTSPIIPPGTLPRVP